MQDINLRSFKASITMEPIVLRGYYVKLITYQQEFFRRVTFYEAIPPFQAVNVGAVAAGTQSVKTAVTNLDLWDNEFGQWRWYPMDNVQVRLYLPSGVGKWQLKNIQVGLTRSIMYEDPTLVTTEFFSWEDQRPSVECLNFSDYALLAARIKCFGYRFHTEDLDVGTVSQLKAGALPFTPIQCAGMAGGGD